MLRLSVIVLVEGCVKAEAHTNDAILEEQRFSDQVFDMLCSFTFLTGAFSFFFILLATLFLSQNLT